jgi:hypothetical protein
MTWKRELAFWAFMFLVMLGFMYATVHMGVWLSEHWGAYVNVREGR